MTATVTSRRLTGTGLRDIAALTLWVINQSSALTFTSLLLKMRTASAELL